MSIVVLIPTVLCIAALFYWPLTKTFLNVYLPVVLLVPIYYYWKVASLPAINFSEAVLMPLGIAVAVKEFRHWRFTVGDIAVAVFVFACFFSEWRSGRHTNAIFDGFDAIFLAFAPYMIGKTLIEPYGIRVATAKRFVFLLFLACLVAVYEYPMGQNPFSLMWSPFFPDEAFAWKTQIRWGFGRVSGPFGQSELAGLILFTGLILALWVSHRRQWSDRFRGLEWTGLRKGVTITVVIILTQITTQARGPWLGCLAALPVSFIGRAKHTRRAAWIVFSVLALFTAITYSGLKNYVSSGAPTSDEQETAQYRQHLLDNYTPIAQQGGVWGWGENFPQVPGQSSIDNEYLLVALMEGMAGLAAFSLLSVSTVLRLGSIALTTTDEDDRTFAFAMLGIFIGILGTISTVFLGNQTYELFFFLAGWAQGIRRPIPQRAEAFRFERVFT